MCTHCWWCNVINSILTCKHYYMIQEVRVCSCTVKWRSLAEYTPSLYWHSHNVNVQHVMCDLMCRIINMCVYMHTHIIIKTQNQLQTVMCEPGPHRTQPWPSKSPRKDGRDTSRCTDVLGAVFHLGTLLGSLRPWTLWPRQWLPPSRWQLR